jgi:nucleoside 2-deoxyribosyltransferase
MNKECFVIQPISDEKFTKRYDDIYKPAIETVGFSAYRVDLDPTVKIPIEDIESKIKNAEICFADISIDNPNVWYELGYAFAAGKDVVMVCDESRKDFPFDVRHKNIIKYKTESASDFNTLKEKIIEKITAYIQSQKTTEKILENPIKETDGFQPYELTLLAFIIGEQYTDEKVANVYELRSRMTKAGFNDTAFSIAMRLLKVKDFITTRMDHDFDGNEYAVCSLSDNGVRFILKNTHLFDLQQSNKKEIIATISDTDDLPF